MKHLIQVQYDDNKDGNGDACGDSGEDVAEEED